jgi:hypothetical protein
MRGIAVTCLENEKSPGFVSRARVFIDASNNPDASRDRDDNRNNAGAAELTS